MACFSVPAFAGAISCKVTYERILVPPHVHLWSAKDSNGRACVLRIGTVKSIFKEAVLFCVRLDNTATPISGTQLFIGTIQH